MAASSAEAVLWVLLKTTLNQKQTNFGAYSTDAYTDSMISKVLSSCFYQKASQIGDSGDD